MSVLEMQLAVIKEVSALKNEKALKDILEYLSKIPSKNDGETLNLSQHYDKVKSMYGNVLKKLAQ